MRALVLSVTLCAILAASPARALEFPGCASDYAKRNVLNAIAKGRGLAIPFPFGVSEKLYEAYLEPEVPLNDKFVEDYTRAFMNLHIVQFKKGRPVELRYGTTGGVKNVRFSTCTYRFEANHPSRLVPVDAKLINFEESEWGWSFVRTSPVPKLAADYENDNTVVAFFATPGSAAEKGAYRIRARAVPAGK